MPLIMLCGFPASGKTTVARQLETHLASTTGMKVVLLNEENLNIKRNHSYVLTKDEKDARGTIKAAVDRNISKSAIVICDSLNYIKGFRYEQWCSSRSAGTPCCVVWCKVSAETAIKRNEENESKENQWNEKLQKELIMRFEPPSSSRRWENPTFEIEETDSIPFDDITNCVTTQTPQQKSMATQHAKISDTNYLHDLDKITQDIVREVLKGQSEIQSNIITLTMSQKKVRLSRPVQMAELRRLRQQFIYLARSLTQTKADYGEKSNQQTADEFIDYLNANLQ